MKVTSDILHCIHLDKSYSLMTGRNLAIVYEMFKLLDIHGTEGLNDIQFYVYMKTITDLNRKHIYQFFDMLDIDGSGEIDFDEFYLLMCILISIKDHEEKQFIYAHSRTVFDLMDDDGSNTISAEEFEKFGYLFNFRGDAVKRIFNEFDVSGDQELDYREFRMFAVACVDKQKELANKVEMKSIEKKRNRMLKEKKRLLKEIKKNQVVPVTDHDEGDNTETFGKINETAQGHFKVVNPSDPSAPRWSIFSKASKNTENHPRTSIFSNFSMYHPFSSSRKDSS